MFAPVRNGWRRLTATRRRRVLLRVATAVVVLAIGLVAGYARIVNWIVPEPHRPGRIHYPVERLTAAEFERVAADLQGEATRYASVDTARANPAVYAAVAQQLAHDVRSFDRRAGFSHIERFRRAGIRAYEGPKTCLQCHRTMRVADGHGGYRSESLRDNVERSVHFGLNRTTGFNTYGFDGKLVRGIPMGKIDRACGIPGSFTWTGWATLVHTKTGELRSDGCGQCHAGGQYGPMTGTMFRGYRPVDEEFESVDCLICHSAAYDMNRRTVVQDPNGKYRWDQDRSMRAAMAVVRPTSDNCLRCHEHNHGGDLFPGNVAAHRLGYVNRRLLHPGAKRGTPTTGVDVHYRAGMQCLDCHTSLGHLIARGTRGTDLVSNDLPGVEVSCRTCHGSTPHVQDTRERAFLNAHTDKLECETCHISHLTDDNVVLRDWTRPVYNAEEGIWVYRDSLRSGKPGEAIVYRWHNGAGTFMAGALGDNPNGLGLYRAFETHPDTAFAHFDYAGYYERTFRPIARTGVSRIAPFKRFNAKMYEDMANQGPFGGMLMPFDYNTYYETGRPKDAVLKAVNDPIIRMMYGPMFKLYMMDAFMHYMGIAKGWTYPFSGRLEAKWMRQDATLMLNHSITKDALACERCHAPAGTGIMPFEALGYPPARVADLRHLPELELVRGTLVPAHPRAGARTAAVAPATAASPRSTPAATPRSTSGGSR